MQASLCDSWFNGRNKEYSLYIKPLDSLLVREIHEKTTGSGIVISWIEWQEKYTVNASCKCNHHSVSRLSRRELREVVHRFLAFSTDKRNKGRWEGSKTWVISPSVLCHGSCFPFSFMPWFLLPLQFYTMVLASPSCCIPWFLYCFWRFFLLH